MKLVNSIKYTNLESLTENEQESLKEILEKGFPEIARLIKNDFNLRVHTKVFEKEKVKKYSIHLKLESPTKMFNADVSGWDLRTAVHKAVDKIKNELRKLQKTKNRSNYLKIKRLKETSTVIRRN